MSNNTAYTLRLSNLFGSQQGERTNWTSIRFMCYNKGQYTYESIISISSGRSDRISPESVHIALYTHRS